MENYNNHKKKCFVVAGLEHSALISILIYEENKFAVHAIVIYL